MDPFRTASKISVPTAVFGVFTLILGWMTGEITDQIAQLQLGEIALVFLALFFFSLLSDRIQEIEEKLSLAGGKKTAKKKPAGRPAM